MFKIIDKKELVAAPKIISMNIEAPLVAKAAKPGQFIVIRNDEKGERVPLTICDYDTEKGTVQIVFQVMGYSTDQLSKFEPGDAVADFVGPLGQPSEFVDKDLEELKKEKMLFIAGGVGTAPVYPQVKWLAERGIKADVLVGAKTKDLFILKEQLQSVAENVYFATDDGSYGFHGLVTDLFKDLVDNQGKDYNHVIAIGPMIMMKFVALTTKAYNIKTTVSLNPIMVDATGMCGACRVSVGNEVKFACVDGPEFDGHLVNFDEALRRQTLYKTEEGREKLKIEEGNTHSGGCGLCGGDK